MGCVCHVVPSIRVHSFIIDVPQNGSVSESLTHTSGHRLVKSTQDVPHPGGIFFLFLVEGAAVWWLSAWDVT